MIAVRLKPKFRFKRIANKIRGLTLQLRDKYSARPVGEKDLEKILSWRNRPEVRLFMYSTHEITLEEHLRWFEKVKSDPTKSFIICCVDDCPVGFVGLTNINQVQGTADWGFYSGVVGQRGLGNGIGYIGLNHAFEVLKIRKLNGEVLDYNEKSIAFHKKMGFQVEGLFKAHHLYEGQYRDVYRFALFASEWESVYRCKVEEALGK